jgi:hypothetical protein
MSHRLPGLTLQGILLFLFIPLVLVLFLRQPLGPGWSVGLGLAIMFGHRFVAQPWMAKFADARCLWCGRVGTAETVPVVASGRTWLMRACSAGHAASIRRFLAFVFRFRLPVALGIFVPLAWLLVASVAAAAGHVLLPHAANARIFRVVVAATVVMASLAPVLPDRLGGGSAPAEASTPAPSYEPVRCPFPLHNLFLLGIANTLWVFRVIGAWWLVDAWLNR